jgi:Family of unknown function (DUF6308)
MERPDCSRYVLALDRIQKLISAERATSDLDRYLTSFSGARFDGLIDRSNPNEFTAKDFEAVRKLNVSVLMKARIALTGEKKPDVQILLGTIPADLDLWNVAPANYDATLGPDSPAWRLWRLLFDLQQGARSSGRGVTAGKLLHGKRPRLVPIFDRARIHRALGIDHRHFWEATWCALRNPEVRSGLRRVQGSVDPAADLSLLRVLDIIAWMSLEPG